MPATAAPQAGCSAFPGSRLTARKRRTLLGTLSSALLATAATVAAVVGGGVTAASASTHAPAGHHDWIATGWNIHLANKLDPGTARHFFNTSSSFGTGPAASASPVSDGFAANAVLVFDSYAQFASDVQSGDINPNYKWVLYDPEEWSQTPVAEQLNPVKYLVKFGKLAHAHGYKVIEAPGRDLGNVAGAACPKLPGENLNEWYVHCDIAGAAAAASDVYVLQNQVNTANLAAYDALFASARRQALAANPRVIVDSELSTNYGTASQMAAAARSVNANGFYVSITHPAIGQADQFFRMMRAAGY